MIIDGDPNVPQDAPSRSFAQLGLLVGSFMFWEEDSDDPQPQRLENLMRWTLKLPPVLISEERYYPRLGISASGFAHIYYTVLQAKKRQEPLSKTHEADKKTIANALFRLVNLSDSTQQDIADPLDITDSHNIYQHFEHNLDDFARYIKDLNDAVKTAQPHHSAAGSRTYIWLDPDHTGWWMTAMKKSLDDCLRLMREKVLTLSDVERICAWLECSVFVPLDITQPFPTLDTAEDEEMRERSADLAVKLGEAAERVYREQRESRYLYLSWNLFAFNFWENYWRKKLIHRTMLALWTAWPHELGWAPMPPEGIPSHLTSLDEVAHLLTDLLPALRRYFLLIKDAHRLSLTYPSFEKTGQVQTHYPPTFYFADPVQRLPKTAAYVKNTDVHHLISNCIGYNDPFADTLSWTSLERIMVTVRGETTQTSHYKARYLLLPIEASPDNGKMIGLDLDYIVGLLTFLEYTVGLEAEDIYKRVKDIESERAVDSDTIDTVDYITRRLANIVSSLPVETLKSVTEEFAELQLLLGRVKYSHEKMRGEAIQLEQQYDFLVNRTIEFLREKMHMAPVPNLLPLSKALMETYPYRSLRRPILYLPVYTAQLVTSIERVGALLTLLSTAISNYALKQRERQDRQIQIFVAILAIVALLVALPQFFPSVNAISILNLFGYETIYNSNNGKILLVTLAIVLLAFLVWFCIWILLRMKAFSGPKKERNRFRECVRKLWNLADHTTYMYKDENRNKEGLSRLSPPPHWFKNQWNSGQGADNIDSQATSILQELWLYLDSLSHESSTNKQRTWSDNKQQASKDLIAQVRILSRLIHVFVLRPDLIPLPRALCILRYKSLQFLEKSTIGDNEFRDSLKYAGYSSDQVKSLQDWLDEPVNLKWIRDNSVNKVAEALGKKGITANPSKDVMNNWQGNLFS